MKTLVYLAIIVTAALTFSGCQNSTEQMHQRGVTPNGTAGNAPPVTRTM